MYCVGGSLKGNDILILCAFGTEEIFKKTNSNNSAVKKGDVYWYFMPGKSFGFSDKEEIFLSSADTIKGENKLSWHIDHGGFRIGDKLDLNNADNYERIILFK